MKKILLTLLVFAQAILLIAQVPNGGFENWTAGTGYDDPDEWTTPNALLSGTAVVVEQTTDVHSGTYAAKLISTSVLILTVPGVMGTGAINQSTYAFEGGFPISNSPAALSGWFKYQPGGTDTAMIFAMLTNWNGTSTDTVAAAVFFATSASNTYSQFSVPFNYAVVGQYDADTAFVMVTSSFDIAGAQAGSTLYVDDLSFDGNIGINNVTSTQSLSLFPNPAQDRITIKIEGISKAERVVVFDVLGNKIKSYDIDRPENFLLNTSSFADGLYFYKVEDEAGQSLSSGKFSVKH